MCYASDGGFVAWVTPGVAAWALLFQVSGANFIKKKRAMLAPSMYSLK
jgi:hypothetical protein